MASYTAQQLADLRAAIATGALRVETQNMKTEFRSLDEMQRLERIMAAAVEGATVTRTSYASFSKD
jgi:hypothetical protein